jgi:hypothetical protein
MKTSPVLKQELREVLLQTLNKGEKPVIDSRFVDLMFDGWADMAEWCRRFDITWDTLIENGITRKLPIRDAKTGKMVVKPIVWIEFDRKQSILVDELKTQIPPDKQIEFGGDNDL